MKNNKMPRKYMYIKYVCMYVCMYVCIYTDLFTVNLPHRPVIRENIGDKKLSVEHTPLLVAIYLLECGYFAANISYPYFTQYFAHFEKL